MNRLRVFLTIPLGLIVIVLAVANRHMVELHLWPLPWIIDMPLYVLLLAAFTIGVLAGGVAVWTGRIKRQYRQRWKAAQSSEKPAAGKAAGENARKPVSGGLVSGSNQPPSRP